MVSEQCNSAISLTETGFFVFPVIPNGKSPKNKGWQRQATRDREKIKELWSEEANIGVLAHKFGNRKMVVIDLDVDLPSEKNGVAEFASLCKAHGAAVPNTLTVRTPRGGQHLLEKLKSCTFPL